MSVIPPAWKTIRSAILVKLLWNKDKGKEWIWKRSQRKTMIPDTLTGWRAWYRSTIIRPSQPAPTRMSENRMMKAIRALPHWIQHQRTDPNSWVTAGGRQMWRSCPWTHWDHGKWCPAKVQTCGHRHHPLLGWVCRQLIENWAEPLSYGLLVMQLKKMRRKLRTSSPDLSTKIIVVVLFICIITTIVIVKLLHDSHDEPHEWFTWGDNLDGI